MGAATAWGILSRVTGATAQQAHEIYDRKVAVQSHEAGILDAIEGKVRRLDRSTTRGGAYMDAATSTMQTIIETQSLVELQRIYQENPTDPAAIMRAVDEYSQGAVGQLTAVSPEAAVQLRARLVTQTMPLVNGAIENSERRMALAVQQARKTAAETTAGTTAAVSGEIFTEDPVQGAAASSALSDAITNEAALQSVEVSEGFLLSRLASHQDDAHVINLQEPMKERLAAMISAAPPEIGDGLQIGSGYRTYARQKELYEAWVAGGRRGSPVGRPGGSLHNHGNAVDLWWKGLRLDDPGVPQSVKDWVAQHGADFGMKFPVPGENWHIEVQETRGGSAWTGLKGTAGAVGDPLTAPQHQAARDQWVPVAVNAWFQKQTDKTAAFTQLLDGTLELPMFRPNGERVLVNVREALSADAQRQLENDLVRRMQTERQLSEQARTDEQRAVEARSAATTQRVYDGDFVRGADDYQLGRRASPSGAADAK